VAINTDSPSGAKRAYDRPDVEAGKEATRALMGKTGPISDPTARIVLPNVTPHAVGQLLYLLEVQTSVAGEMLGINTYNQPGVEAGKEATRALMGAEGTIENPAAKGLPADAVTCAALRKRMECK